MKVTEEELIGIWKYFQYCCLPAIAMARYAYNDYINDIKSDKVFCRHETKQAINKIGKHLEALPSRLMAVSGENIRYMNILSDNIDEQFEDEKEELHRAIYISFRNAKWNHLECLAAMHYIFTMLRIASVTFTQCCKDLKAVRHKDASVAFHIYNLQEIADKWEKLVNLADESLDQKKKAECVNLQNIRCNNAVNAIRNKLADIETLRVAMKKSYPWSPNYREDIPYEESADYQIVNNKNGMD